MTDNRATELREKLDALGIEHFDYDKGGRTQTMWEATDGKRHFTYETQDNPAKTAKLVISWFPTPEQAIAATLGYETSSVDEALALLDEMNEQGRIEYEDYSQLHDAIATPGRGTCKLEETESYPSERGMVHVLECSNCGRECEHVNGDYEHCPHCLARNELF